MFHDSLKLKYDLKNYNPAKFSLAQTRSVANMTKYKTNSNKTWENAILTKRFVFM